MNCGYILTPTIISHISTLPACVSPDQPWPLIAPALWPLVSTMPPASFGDSSHCIPVLFVIPKVFKYTPDDPCMVCLPTSLHVVNFHGKCGYIYHTWINWENILQTLFITIRDGPLLKKTCLFFGQLQEAIWDTIYVSTINQKSPSAS